MADPVAFMMAGLREKYEATPASPAFTRLYGDPDWGHMFAVLHKRATDPRSQHLTIAWWAQAVLCDST